ASLRSRSASSGVSLPGRGGEDDANLVFGVNGDTGYSLRAATGSPDRGDGGINKTLVAAPIAGHHHRDDLDNDTYVVADCFTHAHTNSDCSVCEYQNLSDYRWAMGTGAEFEQFAAGRHYLYRRSRFNDQWYI
ncbi:MAG: hypothetical protein UV59_C0019G0001, partial [Candidatus Gottesmanbacteria bacterium GW2011_GWA1_43_11]